MTLHFAVDYRTQWGESLFLKVITPQEVIHEMVLAGDSCWTLTLETEEPSLTYMYEVRRGEKVVRSEWGSPHSFVAGKSAKEYVIIDRWQDIPFDKPFFSQAFTQCVNRRTGRTQQLSLRSGYLMLAIEAPKVDNSGYLVLCGNCPELGNWDPMKAPKMNDARFPLWTINLPLGKLPAIMECKLVKISKDNQRVIAWEGGDNRVIDLSDINRKAAVRMSLPQFADTSRPWRGAGVAIPVFSLRSEDDFGVGDFYDLRKMVDWAVATGQNFIQILPINDTTMSHTWTDSYPYNANSTFALHPMYLRLEALGMLSDKSRRSFYESKRKELNALSEIDYEAVNKLKTQYTREIFAQEGEKVLKSDDFSAFMRYNSGWLLPYAAFCVLRDRYRTPDFSNWDSYAVYDESRITQFISKNSADINFVCYQQYSLDRQLRDVREYAHRHGIAIKGDIPIGISRTSVDAWMSPRLFNLDCQAGAPPDDFSVLGQNWGFPTYNWEEMSLDGFAWWKARFRKMAEYFDAYRIDHVLGFFRIWQIPMDAIHGLLGIFNPALPLTPDEMHRSFDFRMDVDQYTHPYITDLVLPEVFGDLAEEVKATYLHPIGYGRYELNPDVDTQRKVAALFAALPENEHNTRICNGLMRLIDDVLFIEDPYEKSKYHPRISASSTYQYRDLNDYQRWCFDRLYNDFFYHRHDEFWYHKAMWKLLPLIDATGMLTCAEDLGMIPHCVPAVMDYLKILTLDIQRMPKNPDCRFGNPADYPYYTVCTTSTHDMGGIRQWWEEDHKVSQAYYNQMLHKSGEAPCFAEPWICEMIINQHLASPAILCILPLQDWLSVDGKLRRVNPFEEQINVPANSRHYWRYRMHITLEQLNNETLFNKLIKGLITDNGRR